MSFKPLDDPVKHCSAVVNILHTVQILEITVWRRIYLYLWKLSFPVSKWGMDQPIRIKKKKKLN